MFYQVRGIRSMIKGNSVDYVRKHIRHLLLWILCILFSLPLNILDVSVQLNSPQVAQDIDMETLKISHRLRMIVHFEDCSMRKMSLSFPLEVITVPQSARGPGRPRTMLDLVSYSGGDDEDQGDTFNDGLPSYRDVLHEGPPPAAFFDDDLSHHPSVFV